MYDAIMDYLEFCGLFETSPVTLAELITWFVFVMVCMAIIRAVLNSFIFVMMKITGGVKKWY